MSSTATAAPSGTGPVRVRQRARETVAVMAVSAAMSGGFATVLLLAASLGR